MWKSKIRYMCNSKGLTLVEILATLVILAIISAIAVPAVFGLIENSREDVCVANRLELKRYYERELVLVGLKHKPEIFEQSMMEFGEEICPVGGVISYLDGDVLCSEHSDADSGDENEDVPYF
ncbi:pilus assembly FimT family protein [Bacillus sp. FJAT-45066]|uniref:pilus assembly FimT family protein n=1 Tax=Bacillus sp. FJAT-45066 TaxID=2011010 RepID=UPI000BB7B9EB|nr:prepilin-type N-terminal cleavage/methylation domain-containing protein [Bacillus sp. FJAT-45066]